MLSVMMFRIFLQPFALTFQIHAPQGRYDLDLPLWTNLYVCLHLGLLLVGYTLLSSIKQVSMEYIFMPPFEKGGAYCVAYVVGMSVSLNLVQLITQERFAPEASNLVGR